MPEQYSIIGSIVPPEGVDRAGIKVQAFDRDLPSLERRMGSAPQILGEAITDAEGHFQITYTLEQFQTGEGIPRFRRLQTKNADLSFHSFDQKGQELKIKSIEALDRGFGPDQIIFNAPAELEVSIYIEATHKPGDSEYEILLAMISPVIEEVPLAELTDDDVSFLLNELGVEQHPESKQQIEWLRRSALLAQETNLPTEAFYGWGRKDMPDTLAALIKMPLKDMPSASMKLVAIPEETLLNILIIAINEHIISLGLKEKFSEIMRQIERLKITQGVMNAHRFIGRLLNEKTGDPLIGFSIRGFDLDAEAKPRDLGEAVTGASGLFRFIYLSSPKAEEKYVQHKLRLEIHINTQSKEKYTTEVMASANANILEIKVPMPSAAESTDHKFTELADALNLKLPEDFLSFLSDKGIHTLSDARKVGGISRLKELPLPADHPSVLLLDAHTDLSRISRDFHLNSALIEKRYDSVRTIANIPRTDFVGDMHEKLGDFGAAKLQIAARAQTRFLDDMISGVAANLANNFAYDELSLAANDALPKRCSCKDCEAAVSPLAYLADLLKYAIDNIEDNKVPVTVASLSSIFLQPFELFTADCDAADLQVRQVRLTIEVLRNYLKVHQPNAASKVKLDEAEQRYRVAAYTSLLIRLGTTYEELRLAEGGDADFRKTLAERLGIDQTHLSDLFLDVDSAMLTEGEIEKRFGLVDTTRDPLIEGSIPLLQTWRHENLRKLWKDQDWPANPPSDSQPLIDPDLITPSDLVNPIVGDPAYDLLKAREGKITAQLTSLKGAPQTLAGFDTNLTTTLGVPVSVFLDIDKNRKEGKSILKSLDTLFLRIEEYDYLLRIRTLTNKGQPILDPEWESVYAILVQVWKRKNRTTWRNEERTAKLILSPDFFQISPPAVPVFPRPQPSPTEVWRAPSDARVEWQGRLQTRIDQEQTIIQALREAISAVEEATLVMLRDALVMASDAVGDDLQGKAEWVTKNLLIDARMDGCAMTTRAAQAIETIQGLFLSLRIEQLADNYQTLKLKADNFEEEWKWMGSYTTWRAAMFVFLYPENILQPSLRNQKTPAFDVLLQKTQTSRTFSTNDACDAARQYSEYFRDICSLHVEASCTSMTRLLHGEGCNLADRGYRCLFYMFGRGEHTGTVYWSAFPVEGNVDYSQSYWEPISNKVKEFTDIIEVVGAVPYKINSGQRYIFLFARKQLNDTQALVYAKYDLEHQKWHTECKSLKVPAVEFYAVVKQQESEVNAPHIVIEVNDSDKLYEGKLLSDGSDWSDGLNKLGTPFLLGSQRHIYGMVSNDEKSFFLILKQAAYYSVNSYLPPRLDCFFYNYRISLSSYEIIWTTIEYDRKYLGSFSWPKNDGIYIVCCHDFEPSDADSSVDYGGVVGQPITFVKRVRVINGQLTVNDVFSSPFSFLFKPRVMPTSGMAEDMGGKAKWLLYQSAVDVAYADQLIRLDDQNLGVWPTTQPRQVMPRVTGPFEIPQRLATQDIQIRKGLLYSVFDTSLYPQGPLSNLTYLAEAYYFVPIQLALVLHRAGSYLDALDRFRTVYDYAVPEKDRKVYPGLMLEESLSEIYKRAQNWSLNPLNPHAVAEARKNTYTRFTILSIVRCMLDYADMEFTRDTAESIPPARHYYLLALELMNSDTLKQQPKEYEDCDEMIGTLDDLVPLIGNHWSGHMQILQKKLTGIKDTEVLSETVTLIHNVFTTADTQDKQFSAANQLVAKALLDSSAPSLGSVLVEESRRRGEIEKALLNQSTANSVMEKVALSATEDFKRVVSMVSGISALKLEREKSKLKWLRESVSAVDAKDRIAGKISAAERLDAGRLNVLAPSYIGELSAIAEMHPLTAVNSAMEITILRKPTLILAFCVPPNPTLQALRLRAQLNLRKLRSCRNIAGMRRELENYSASTDTNTGLPTIGAGGQLTLPGINIIRPTLYRYPVLIERAKQLVSIAAQIEASMLAAIERRSEKAYQLFTARQQLGLVQANTQLQILRLTEASHGVKLSKLQKERAEIQAKTYQEWINKPLNEYETDLLNAYFETADRQRDVAATEMGITIAQAMTTAATAGPTAAVAASAATTRRSATDALINAQRDLQIASFRASYERRKDEWLLQQSLVEQDKLIGDEQIELANDHVEIVKQEKIVAEMQASHAKDTVEFLINQFNNEELYELMSDTLEQVYRFFLQQATAMSKLAASQLGFERQDAPPTFIRDDYWIWPSNGSSSDNSSVDRKGLTGSACLLQDVYQLDQYAFDTKKRKLELTKTISLAQLAPEELQHLRETGVMVFSTPMEMFDRDFPGHYLRLIKRVRASVIALIPPTHGIHATLTTAGLSRTVIGPEIFQTIPIRRDPELVALTSPSGSTGTFELETQQSDMLFPFEGNGVESSWEFRMPKAANQFDYQSIADVLITIEYTALNSFDYREQVIQTLKPNLSSERSFSFRHYFADQWYDLHNPDQTATPMVVRFKTFREDFPPNMNTLRIQQILLYFARKEGKSFEISVTHLHYTALNDPGLVGGNANSIDSAISTRRGNAVNWIPMIGKLPVGEWELALPDTPVMRKMFIDEEIKDILLVITYSGRTPDWPS
ncbi:MAG TPA: hypothetical protein PKJ85_08850 [Nitrosomonas nitrosa]|nr:hypothetical protein [Nitrosomonas nitrosa]